MGQPVVSFTIGCRNNEKTTEFYSKLFDWKIEQLGPAAMIQIGGGKDIDRHITWQELHKFVTIYVQVDNLQEYIDKAILLGGAMLVPPSPVGGPWTFCLGRRS